MKKKITTIQLNDNETFAEMLGTHCAVQNLGDETIYASTIPNISAGADDVIAIRSGCSATILHYGIVYLKGIGTVQLMCMGSDTNPFDSVSEGDGSGADETARAEIEEHSSNAEIHVTDDEKALWNGKAELDDIPTALPANGGNAETVGGYSIRSDVIGIADNWVTVFASDGTQSLVAIKPQDMVVGNAEKVNGKIIRSVEDGQPDTNWFAVYDVNGNITGLSPNRAVVATAHNAETFQNHSITDFVLKSEYDLLLLRVEALESK